MARSREIQNAFTGGEITPTLMGRTDLAVYAKAAETLENATVFKQGGATRRAGSRFVYETKDSSKASRLIPFENSVGSYLLEIGDIYARFYRNKAIIVNAGIPIEIVPVYLEDEIGDIQVCAVGDILFFAHPLYYPKRLSRNASDLSWTFTNVSFYDGPWLPMNTSAKTLTPGATTGIGISLTASASTFLPEHVGAYFRLKHGATIGFCHVTGYTSSTVVTVTIDLDFGATTATTEWWEGAWSDVQGYPRTVTSFEQRVVWGGTESQPAHIWANGLEEVTDYNFNMSPGTGLSSDAYTFRIAQAREILWIKGQDALIVGATNGIFPLYGGSDGTIAPDNPPLSRIVTTRPSSVIPVGVQNTLLYLERSGIVLRQQQFNWQTDSYDSLDLTALSNHIAGEGGVIELAYQQEPGSMVWAARADGELAALTFEPGNNVISWHRHGVSGVVESIAVVPSEDATGDQVWLLVNRTINGATARYVEYLDTVGGFYDSLQVDSGLVYSGVATDTITGLDHLEGEEVDILGGGLVYARQTVSGGEVTGIDPEVTFAEVGLPFSTTIQPVRPEMRMVTGTGQTARKRQAKIFVRVYQSAGFAVNGKQVTIRYPPAGFGAAPDLFTGDVEVTNLGYDRDGFITITQPKPLPLTVLATISTLLQED